MCQPFLFVPSICRNSPYISEHKAFPQLSDRQAQLRISAFKKHNILLFSESVNAKALKNIIIAFSPHKILTARLWGNFMKRDISLWQLGGFSFCSLGGTLLHFLFDITNGSPLSTLISGVNESTWEHMKLLFFPMLIFALIQSRFFKEYKSFWSIKLTGITVGLVLIPVLFYSYNGMFGRSPDWLNILIFFICAAAAFLTEARMFKKASAPYISVPLSLAAICVIGVMFAVFTFFPPHIPLFCDPVTGGYGIKYSAR